MEANNKTQTVLRH